MNYVADQISRIVDYDDYTINVNVFVYFDEAWGPHPIHRFTCYYNKKANSLNSRYFHPGTNGVNAFTRHWAYEIISTCVPPVYLTGTDINHLRICGAAETLIVPLWISAHYWISLCEDRVHWNDFVHDWMILPHKSDLSLRGEARNAISVMAD